MISQCPVIKAAKGKIYDIITADDDDDDNKSNDINLTQNLGLSLSNAVRKDGITVIQMANIVTKRISTLAVGVLKDLEKIEYKLINAPFQQPIIDLNTEEQEQIEEVEKPRVEQIEYKQDLESYMEDRILAKVTLKEFKQEMEHKYISKAKELLDEKDTNKILKIRPRKNQRRNLTML